MSEQPALLLFDGTCGFCAESVQFVLSREKRRRTLRFASLQSSPGAEVRERHPELEGVDSVIWLEAGSAGQPERVFVRSAAVFRVLHYLGGVWTVLAWVGAIVPAFRARCGLRLGGSPPPPAHSPWQSVSSADARAARAVR